MFVRSIPLLLISISIATAAPRVANTTITLPAAPPETSVELENAFTGLGFSSPLCLRSPAGDTQRLFICEKGGDLELIPDVTAATPTKTIFLNVDGIVNGRGETFRSNSEMGLLAVAFHPDYATNGYFFTVYNVQLGGVDYQRLSRWHDPDITDTIADPDSEEILIEMRDDAGNHNGGDLHFGPDGYLYMSWGDEGNQNDSLNNSQRIDKDFWSSITRIDVDLEAEDYTLSDGTGSDDANVRPNNHAAVKLYGGNPLYEVPADNHWVGATSFNGVAVTPADVRTEFFAVGFRNPWRFSFDSLSGELWVGDVGQGAWEEVAVVQNGENHGWAWHEGDANGPKYNNPINGASRTNATHTPPVWDYGHGNSEFQGNSVTGGVVYRGSRFPSLAGKYIFSDYSSGNIWALERTATAGEPDVERIAGEGGIAGFGTDPSNGDVLIADLGGQIRRLVVNDNPDGTFPATLSATGIFSDLTNLTPQPGVIAYEVNLPFWSDYAIKRRWFAIKNTVAQFGYTDNGSWTTPAGSIFVKHFDLELERGNPATKKRIETRVLVRNRSGETTDSTLVASAANCRVLVPANASLGQTWTATGFDDASWTTAVTGVGYDENTTYDDELGPGGDLGNDLNDENTSVYVRIPFAVTDAASVATLTLRMKYDDGFVAFLNGQRVADANPPEDASPPETLAWDSEASGDNPDSSAQTFQDFDISGFASVIVDGTNVLAIQGLNGGIDSSDMLVLPELIAGRFTSFTEGSYGVSYRWNEAGTEAFLVGNAGEEFDLSITTPGGPHTQAWSIPSRAACLVCHTPEAGHTLSFNTRQLNRDGTLGGSSGNYITLLRDCNYVDTAPDPSTQPRHIGPAETAYSLEARVRSYLDVNCAYCHQDPGTAPTNWLGNHHLTLDETGLINGLSSRGTQHPDDRLVVPSNPTRSILLSRVAASNGYSRMPALGTNEPDTVSVQLLTDWINQEASALTTYEAWRIFHFGNDTSAEGEPDFDADGDTYTNVDEWLGLTNPRDSADFAQTNGRTTGGIIEVDIPGSANRRVTVQRSTNMLDWIRWEVPGNDGIPRNPSGTHTLTAPPDGPREFFRLLFEE